MGGFQVDPNQPGARDCGSFIVDDESYRLSQLLENLDAQGVGEIGLVVLMKTFTITYADSLTFNQQQQHLYAAPFVVGVLVYNLWANYNRPYHYPASTFFEIRAGGGDGVYHIPLGWAIVGGP